MSNHAPFDEHAPTTHSLARPSFDSLAARLLDVSPHMASLTSDSEHTDSGFSDARPRRLHVPSDSQSTPSHNDTHDATDEEDERQAKWSYRVEKPPPLHISVTPSERSERAPSSTSSSLDPYYFSVPSPSSSSPIDLPPSASTFQETPRRQSSSVSTSKRSSIFEPKTPGRDPANIDRKGLVGVGELTTPRWSQPREGPHARQGSEDDRESSPPPSIEQLYESSVTPSWVHDTFDGLEEDQQQASLSTANPPLAPPASISQPLRRDSRPIRTRPSIADESGGEEILYKPPAPRERPAVRVPASQTVDSITNASVTSAALLPSSSSHGSGTVDPAQISAPAEPNSPPSAYPSQPRPRKRTSDEFERDHAGVLISKVANPSFSGSDRERDERIARKHRSLGVGAPLSDKRVRDRRRGDSVGLSLSASTSTKQPASSPNAGRDQHHSRQSSTSSSHEARRGFPDFSHLPPSPSTNTIPHFLRHSGSITGANALAGQAEHEARRSNQTLHSSPSVAHSLLRGTQEGWSGLDDSSTAEALRKLDGIQGRSLRARSSIGSGGVANGGSSANSRSGTPGSKHMSMSGWEGLESVPTNPYDRHTAKSTPPVPLAQDDGPNGSSSEAEAFAEEAGDYVVPGGEDYAITSHPSVHLSKQLSSKSKEPNTPSSVRTSYGLKRGSASSASLTAGTPSTTASSRDSTSLSTATSTTSTSALSHRHSGGKLRRGSMSSDVSSVHSSDFASQKDRAAAIAAGFEGEDGDTVRIPPVPPIPKAYQSPSSASFSLSPRSQSSTNPSTPPAPLTPPEDPDTTVTIPSIDVPPTTPSKAQPSPGRGPTKKWSFSSALNLKMPSSSHSTKEVKSPLSPNRGPAPFSPPFTNGNTDQYSPSARLHPSSSSASLVPGQSMPPSPTPQSIHQSRTPDRGIPSRSETASSSSTRTQSQVARTATSPPTAKPTVNSRRLTPSNIPFFKRSSSSSMMNAPQPSVSPVLPAMPHHASSASISTLGSKSASTHSLSIELPTSGSSISTLTSVHTPLQASKKPSVLSLLKGSSSRKSIVLDHPTKAELRTKEKEEKAEKKKDEKDRSESRISILMGRKRGKTLSATEQKGTKPVSLPPMQMAGLPASTTQRLASLKAGQSGSMPPPSSTSRRAPVTEHRTPTNKASDSSLRSIRHNLPPIAGSPSVGSVAGNSSSSIHPPSSSHPRGSAADTRETPTKIPRISSRMSTLQSPASTLKSSSSVLSSRRASLLIGSSIGSLTGKAQAEHTAPSPHASFVSDFGVLEPTQTPTERSHFGTTTAATPRSSVRASPSSVSRVPRQILPPSSTSKTRDHVSFTGLRKSSAPAVSATTANSSDAPSHSSRFAGLSPSKSLKLLSPKLSLPAGRIASSSTTPAIATIVAPSTPSSGRQSLSTPSPAPSPANDEEALADDEMVQYIKRHQARKLAAGATQEELDEILKFPEPIPAVPPSSPTSMLRSSQATYLSPYERSEILEYRKVYCIGAHSEKVQATTENSTNNYGFDDDRGDYLIIPHDHLAYRYEIIDVLGKGSFGQVLNCRDHCTGESVAIKIIRNKKRFHHQALVEIKILENLKKWDPEEKHHVIKMHEHFYFRDHLCIVMELLSINLYELIKANGFAGFSTVLIRRFTTQMLGSLALMRHHRVVHCDLKPENVLLQHPAKSALKVIDFGSSCFEHEKVYTYIQSRFYRSPEVILGMNYHMAIDMWSLGCILAELYTGYPIFPGENEQEQLSCIMEVLGLPDKDLIARSSRKKLFFDPTGVPRPVVNSRGRRRRPGTKTLAQALRCDEEHFVDFVAKCLHWDPERRLKPQNAMRHPFITAGRKLKANPPPAVSSGRGTSSLSSRPSKAPAETPKKPVIGAPTPLAARASTTRITATGATVSATPSQTPGLGNAPSTGHRSSLYRPAPSSTYSSRSLAHTHATSSKSSS